MKAVIIGATGAVGRDLLSVLALDPAFDAVEVIVRREPRLPQEGDSSKFHVHIVDFDKPETWQDAVYGDVFFSSLGTSKKQAGSKEAQWHVDYDYQMAFAKVAREHGMTKAVVVSSIGADAKSGIFYLKLKGRIEEDMEALGFPQFFIVRPPSLIRHPAKRWTETASVKALQALNTMGLMKHLKPMPTVDVAKAMAALAKNETHKGTQIINGQDIRRYP